MTPVPTVNSITLYLDVLWYAFTSLLPLWIGIAFLYLIERRRRDDP